MSRHQAPPTPSATIPGTTQQLLFEWMKEFVTVYNQGMDCGNMHVDREAYRQAVNEAIVNTLQDFRHGDKHLVHPLYFFDIKVMDKTWHLTHPGATSHQFSVIYSAHEGMDALSYMPPFLDCGRMAQAGIDRVPNAIDSLERVVLESLESQFHAGIGDFKTLRDYEADWRVNQADFEKALVMKKRGFLYPTTFYQRLSTSTVSAQDNSRVNLGHMSSMKSGRAGRDGEDVDMGMEESRFQQTGLATAGKGRAPS